jgi:DNA-binding GntR family transcriptional regulator
MADTLKDGVIPRTTMVDTVADRLRTKLITGAIKPGERIRASELEKDFDVSHIPIREALRRLEAEGLVETVPQRGAIAATVGLEDLTEIWDLRRLLEGQVARRSAERMSDAGIEVINSKLGELLAVGGDFRTAEFRKSHYDFHWALLAPGATGWIRRMYDQLWLGSDRYIQLYFIKETDADPKAFAKVHRQLARAAASRDPERLEALHIQHLSQAETEVRAAYLAMAEAS